MRHLLTLCLLGCAPTVPEPIELADPSTEAPREPSTICDYADPADEDTCLLGCADHDYEGAWSAGDAACLDGAAPPSETDCPLTGDDPYTVGWCHCWTASAVGAYARACP